jgi:hypothetical protein
LVPLASPPFYRLLGGNSVFWSSDTPQAWLLALALVATFVIFIATPFQLLCRFSSAKLLPYLIGAASGPIGVLLALLFFSRYPVDGPEVSVYEMRGGTHLILMQKDRIAGGSATFDLMVDDLRATHERFKSLGLDPSPIEARPAIDHEVFTIREPAGHVITFFSSHASGKPI